ncbi:hypothetical protein JCM3765_001381 [Sporobolomyces pararoseus]
MSFYKLRKIDTTSTPSRSHSSSPVQQQSQSIVGGGGGDLYCESPDSLFPPHQQIPRSRRRETSPSTTTTTTTSSTVIGMSQSQQQQQQQLLQQTRRKGGGGGGGSEIPFIGGGFSSYSRPLLTKRGSNSQSSSTITGYLSGGGGGRRRKCTKLIGILCGILLVYWVAKSYLMNSHEPSRKKLTEKWWEIPEEQLDPEDLSALLPKPTIISRPLPTKPPPPLSSSSSSGLTLSEILKLPSTFSPSSTNYTALIHLTSSSQLLPSHLEPILSSLTSQSPLSPSSIILLCPSGMEPPTSIFKSFGSIVSILNYDTTISSSISTNSKSSSPLLTISNSILQGRIKTEYLFIIDGHFPSSSIQRMGKDYVKILLHSFGTKEFGTSLLSSGGLSLSSSSSSSSFGGRGDECIYPSHDSSKGGVGVGISEKISIPSTPFLLPTSWLLPQRSSSSSPDDDREISMIHSSSTIFQGIPKLNQLTNIGIELSLSFSLWLKNGIPCYALPIPLTITTEEEEEQGMKGGNLDGWVCEKLKRNLLLNHSEEEEEEEGVISEHFRSSLESIVRNGFKESKRAGDGLRKIKGDKRKGGIISSSSGGGGRGISLNALERAREMKKGSLVLLLSGKEDLDSVKKLACRFGATTGEEEVEEEELEDREDRELRIVVADWDEDRDKVWDDGEDELCHLEIIPLLPSSSTSTTTPTTTTSETSISLPLIDILDSGKLDPAPGVVIYLTDGSRSREFEEVLKWIGGIFGVKKGGDRLSRLRMEKESVASGDGSSKGRMTVIGIESEELKRAEWIGALPIEALRHWHTPRIDISVITNDRPVSLHRLLVSLRSAHYFGDDVSLSLNLEQTADRLTHRLVDDFRWSQGPLQLRHRILQGGLMPAIVESWYPTSNDTYGVLLEDDVEVSPLFYGWLKFTILKYRYTLSGRLSSSRLFGISLYQQKNIELKPEGRQPFDAHKLFDSLQIKPNSIPYLSQIPCSWGAAYFPEHWKEFHSYLSLRLSELALPISEPIVPQIRSNRWPKSWKKYFIELVYLRGYTMLYPNYPNFESLSTNHLEKGTHVKTSQVEEKKKVLFEVPLLGLESSLVDSLPDQGKLPDWNSLPVLDLWGSLSSKEELLERGWQTTRQIGSCKTLPDLVVDHPRLKYDARELLCKKDFSQELGERIVKAVPLPRRDEGPRVENRLESESGKVIMGARLDDGDQVEKREEKERVRREESSQSRKEVSLFPSSAVENTKKEVEVVN